MADLEVIATISIDFNSPNLPICLLSVRSDIPVLIMETNLLS